MNADCIFCKIVNKEIPSKIVYENDDYIAFENIRPSAPVHVMLITKKHIDKTDTISGKIEGYWDGLMSEAGKVIKKLGLDKTGYRIVNNGAGYHAIDHEHIHILGGYNWRPKDDL